MVEGVSKFFGALFMRALIPHFTFSSIFWPYSTISVSILITRVLTSASDRLAISSLLSCIFFWSFDLFFHLGHFFLFWHASYIVRGGALGIHQGGATHFVAWWCCMWGRCLRGNSATCSALGRLSVISSLLTSKLGPSGAAFWVGGFVYILGPCRSLQWTLLWGWEFLPLLQHPHVFSVRGSEASFPWAGLWGLSCSPVVPPSLSMHECGAAGAAGCCTAYPVHSTIHHLSGSGHVTASPLHPGCPSPLLLPVWMNFSSLSPWLSDFRGSIFCQFCLFFVFKLLLSFFWLCKEVQYVYLHLHLGQKLQERILKAAISQQKLERSEGAGWQNIQGDEMQGLTTKATLPGRDII